MTKSTKKLIVSLIIYLIVILGVELVSVLAVGVCNRLLFHRAFFARVYETFWGVVSALVAQLIVSWMLPRLRLGRQRKTIPSGVEPPLV
jgi:hypothetical protein